MTWPLCLMGCLLAASLDAVSSCSFPGYIQTNGTTPPRDWRGRALDRFTRLQLRITVDGDQLRQWSNESSTLTFTRTCLEVVDGDKYLVSHREKGQRRVSHACLQFVRRSEALFQVRSGGSSDRPDLGLCTNTTWQLDGWLVVDRSRIGHSTVEAATNPGRERCAIRGGFSARISPSSSSSGGPGGSGASSNGGVHVSECNGGGSEVRLESRCMDGAEDLYIYFRRPDCLPEDLHVNGTPPPQRFACLADWTDGHYSFVMLRHERLPQLWLLRLPTRFLAMDDSFNAYIFKDLFASTSSKVADLSVGHVHMGVVRDPPRPVTSLCVDDHEWCASKSDACATETAFGCARTCHLCNATRPFVCSFPLDWIGVWIDTADGRSVTFNQTAVTVDGGSGGGGSDTFHCIDWRGFPPGGSGGGGGGTHIKSSSDVMLVATYGNGCRLRYLCIRVLKKSPSVLYAKFSRAVLWPFNVTSVDMIDCRLFTFLPETGGGPSGLLPGKHFRLLYSQQPRQPVQCNLPVALYNLTLQFGDGSRCVRSSHVTESVAGTDVLLTVLGCHALGPLPKTFECILSFRATPTNDLTIVVRSVVPQTSLPSSVSSSLSSSSSSSLPGRLAPSTRGAIYCWVFPDDRPTQFYLYEGSNCNESARRDSHEKRPGTTLSPASASAAAAAAAVIFSKTDFDASTIRTTVPASRPVLRRYQPNPSSSSSLSSWGNASNETFRWTNAATENTDLASTNANPLVVLLAVVVFALFYLPCLFASAS